jgi:hypothetical protein
MMLDRAKIKTARSAINRRHYLRRKEHKRCINIAIGEAEIGLLQKLSWLNESDARNPAAVARAVENLLRASAKI